MGDISPRGNYRPKLDQTFFNVVKFIKRYFLAEKKAFRGKKSKVRLTGIAAASATGEKLPMFVISKSKNLHCSKNVKNLPCEYKSQKKSRMNSGIFEEWIRKLDRKFRAVDRKIALIIDEDWCYVIYFSSYKLLKSLH